MTSVFTWQSSVSLCPAHSVLKGQICLLLRVFIHTFAFQSPIKKRGLDFFLDVTSRRSCRPLYNDSTSTSSAWSGIDLDYRDIELFALEMKRDHSVIFEIASKHCISDYFVDYDAFSISPKGFFPTVVDKMVI